MQEMKQIFSESELNEILHLPEVQIQRIGFSLNSEKKTLDLEMQLNANVLIVFFNVCNLTVSPEFNYGNFEGGACIDIHDISSRQLETISWEIREYENESLHFDCESIFVNQ